MTWLRSSKRLRRLRSERKGEMPALSVVRQMFEAGRRRRRDRKCGMTWLRTCQCRKADGHASSMAKCAGVLSQAYSALLHAAVKCGETDLAVDVYGQMKGEGMPRERAIHVTMIEMFVKLGRVSDALAALGELHAIGEPPDTHLYNLVLVAATKLGQPRFALTVYHRCRIPHTLAQPSVLWFERFLIECGAILQHDSSECAAELTACPSMLRLNIGVQR